MTKRKVILHYHIFKNAGTSIDRMLRESYGERWANYDKPEAGAKISPAEMEDYILAHPDLVAVSSHQVVPPLPDKHLEVYPIVLLRHPIDRAYSAYLFEWQKQAGLEQPKGTFSEYVREKFRQPRRNAIEDFQVLHLANRSYRHRNPAAGIGDEKLLENARKFLSEAGVFGIVDRYAESLKLYSSKLDIIFPELKVRAFHENRLQVKEKVLPQRIKSITEAMDVELVDSFIRRNLMDFRFYEYALGQFDQLTTNLDKGCSYQLRGDL